ncbi:rod shape-determining protein MreD [Falsiroseomonas oryziterrae]|uniref:rod shape-determining protein MreD n=1 Tax=Falsiroseomonas oryziterrae TaxID=2911368 RepID=UPI001EFF8A3C|nr:rod shape-determining protein MreD [Roseomonas sp. NPKOSM-4]
MIGVPEPPPSLLRRVEALARNLLPGLLAVVTMIAAAGPTGLPVLAPALTLPQVVFWSIYRPAAMSPPAVFLLGLLLDLLALAPLGSGLLTLLLAHGLALRWRRFLARQGFLLLWLAFCGFAVGAAALGYVLSALLDFALPPLGPALQLAALTACVFPPIALLLGRVHALMLRAEETA